MKQIAIKRGTSFAARADYTPGEGGPATLADIQVTSEIRTPAGKLIAVLTITKAPDGLSFMATVTAGTANWPYGTLHWDIKLVHNGAVCYTETVAIDVLREVTA